MPSEFTPTESREDASAVAQRLGIEYTEIPIDGVHRALRAAVPSATGVVDENLQPRIRATLLMAIANQHNALVLSSGNKSEGAMGYSTLYGDTAGALAPIGDLYKEDVYRLARTYENQIPRRIFDRPPSAELRPNQRDDEDLPPYEEIDAILRELIERNASRTQLIERGFAPTTVDDVLTRYYANEHKRRQSPPGIKVTPKTLGIGRRMPITNAYRKYIVTPAGSRRFPPGPRIFRPEGRSYSIAISMGFSFSLIDAFIGTVMIRIPSWNLALTLSLSTMSVGSGKHR
jgi:NAD+ synthase (glutamine-hydrolysing)